MMERRYMDTRKFAAEIGSTARSVREKCRRGTLPHMKVGSRYYVDARALSIDEKEEANEEK